MTNATSYGVFLALAIVSGCASQATPAEDPPEDMPPEDVPPDAAEPTPDPPPAPLQTIPITMQSLQNGSRVATVQISIGGSAPFTAVLDTGSVGLRVVPGIVPDSAWHVSTTPNSITYGSGVVASGFVATGVVSVGDLSTTSEIALQAITAVGCDASHPSCSAASTDAAAFRFGSFPAIMGVGTRLQGDLGSPLFALGTQHGYVLSLPSFGGAAGVITIDPDATMLARFGSGLVQLPPKGTNAMSWDDTKVPFCLNGYCSSGLLDTGAAAIQLKLAATTDYTALGVADQAPGVPSGTSVQAALGAQTWSFTVGTPPQAGKDKIILSSGSGLQVLGIAPYYALDVFYDYAGGHVGFAPKL